MVKDFVNSYGVLDGSHQVKYYEIFHGEFLAFSSIIEKEKELIN